MSFGLPQLQVTAGHPTRPATRGTRASRHGRRVPGLAAFWVLAALISVGPAEATGTGEVLDANNLGATQSTSFQGSLSSRLPYAQSFVATRSGDLTSAQVTLFLFSPGDPPTAPISMEVSDVDAAGNPVGLPLAVTSIPASDVTAVQPSPGVPPSPASLVTGTFAAPASVVAGQKYALVLRTTSSLNYAVSFADGASYPDGLQLLGFPTAPGGWFQFSSFDLIFATYVRPDVASFGAFSASVSVERRPGSVARLRAAAAFSLGGDSDGIRPLAEDITLALNDYTLTVPGGELRDLGLGRYAYVGTVNGAQVALGLVEKSPGEYLLALQSLDNALRTLANPLDVSLTIGNDRGATQVQGRFS